MSSATVRGMDTDDARLVKLVAKRVGCCLRQHRDAGTVVSEEGPGQTMVWRVASYRNAERHGDNHRLLT